MLKTFYLLLIFGILLTYNTSNAQQRAHYSQYMLNPYLVNPAAGGASDYYKFMAGYRRQWVNFDESPKTFYLSAHGHLGKHIGPYSGKSQFEKMRFHGLGLVLVNDVTGPTSRTTGYLSYSYNMKINKKIRVAFGAFLGMQQFMVNGSKLRLNDPSSPLNSGASSMVPDGSVGSWLYSNKFFFGVSVNQIFQSKLDIERADDRFGTEDNKLHNHYFITGGYNFSIANNVDFMPSMMIKAVNPAPVSADINAKFIYKQMFWVGASYRTQDAMVGMMGLVFKNKYELGYSYDYPLSDINNYSSGSHEVVLGYRLGAAGEIRSPSDFW